MSSQLPFTAFDADNHYYEAEDAFIRHVDPKMHKRCMRSGEPVHPEPDL